MLRVVFRGLISPGDLQGSFGPDFSLCSDRREVALITRFRLERVERDAGGWSLIAVDGRGLRARTLINAAGAMDKITLFSNMVVFSSYAMQIIMSFMMLVMIFILLPRASVSAATTIRPGISTPERAARAMPRARPRRSGSTRARPARPAAARPTAASTP